MIDPRPASETRMRDAALQHAAVGWPVFPLVPRGKVPLIAKAHGGRGHRDATTDEAPIRAWWTRWPLANVGIATGHAFDVLDVDPEHGGNETLAALVARHGPLPTTQESSTGSRGRHFLFRPNARVRCSAGRLGPGLDVRGHGGYIVVPPSVQGHGPLDLCASPVRCAGGATPRTPRPVPRQSPQLVAIPNPWRRATLGETLGDGCHDLALRCASSREPSSGGDGCEFAHVDDGRPRGRRTGRARR